MQNNDIETRSCNDCIDMKTNCNDRGIFDYCTYYDWENNKSHYHKIADLSEAKNCPFYEDDEWVK